MIGREEFKMIKQVYYQIEEPTEPFTDPYGTLLEVGKSVAYNYQGGVRLGIITDAKCKWYSTRKEDSGKQWWCIRSAIKVAEISGINSTVKNINGIVILKHNYE